MTIFRWLMSYCLSGNSAKHDPDSIGHHSPMDLQDREGDHLHHVVCCRLPSGQRLGTLGRPHSLIVLFQISKIGIGSEIVCLQSQPDFGKISRTGTASFIQSNISVPGCHRK